MNNYFQKNQNQMQNPNHREAHCMSQITNMGNKKFSEISHMTTKTQTKPKSKSKDTKKL